jgi:signal peptidase I
MKKIKIIENIKTILVALFLALIIRSLLLQPFYIPSSSMEQTLLVGDRLFVTKYSYGYSRHSLPFSPEIFSGRFFFKEPKRGDVIVFKTPSDNRTDYIKRLIGLPGDTIQLINGDLYLNNIKINKTFSKKTTVFCGNQTFIASEYLEKISNNKSYRIYYANENSMMNTDLYKVPKDHYFFMGDNRDCSKDSRFLSSVGYVHKDNLVGKAQFLFFSNDENIGNFFTFWKWHKSIRFSRILNKII